MTDDLYVAEHVRDALATDPRTAELEVTVDVDARCIVLGGVVATAARRDAAVAVASEVAGGREVLDQTEVVVTTGLPVEERLP